MSEPFPANQPETHLRMLIGDLFLNLAQLQAANFKLEAEKAALLAQLNIKVSGASPLDFGAPKLEAETRGKYAKKES